MMDRKIAALTRDNKKKFRERTEKEGDWRKEEESVTSNRPTCPNPLSWSFHGSALKNKAGISKKESWKPHGT